MSPITGGKIVLAGTLTSGSSLLPFHRHKGLWVRFDDTDEDEDEDNTNHYAKVLNSGEKLWAMPIISEARQNHNGLILESYTNLYLTSDWSLSEEQKTQKHYMT